MEYVSVADLRRGLEGVIEWDQGFVLKDSAKFKRESLDRLTRSAAFGSSDELKRTAAWLIYRAGHALGVWPASIQSLYEARGREEYSGFTVPAINIRGLTCDVARAVFRAALSLGAGAPVFEIARSEIDYTFQRPLEYGAWITAAAIKEGYQGPLFLQGDHFQVNAKKFAADPETELNAVRDLIGEAISSCFFNIDIDPSTLVDLERPDITEQQRTNFETAAELTAHVRKLEPKGITVSVGGEIGEVGGKNSTVEELTVYMDGYRASLESRGSGLRGISKISIQTGTSHGGVPLPDGTVAEVKLDFDILKKLSKLAREKYGMAGAVQHGASTLPDEAFHLFPRTETCEVHLATGFQNMIYDSKAFPEELRQEICSYLREKFAGEKKEGQTDEQFIYKTRKKGFGPFKRQMLDLSEEVRGTIGRELEAKFVFLFKQLGVENTRDLVNAKVTHQKYEIPGP